MKCINHLNEYPCTECEEQLKKEIEWILYEATPEQVEAGLMMHPEFRKANHKKIEYDQGNNK